MKVFFDNNLSPALAATLNGFLQYGGSLASRAYHIKDLPCGRHASDLE